MGCQASLGCHAWRAWAIHFVRSAHAQDANHSQPLSAWLRLRLVPVPPVHAKQVLRLGMRCSRWRSCASVDNGAALERSWRHAKLAQRLRSSLFPVQVAAAAFQPSSVRPRIVRCLVSRQLAVECRIRRLRWCEVVVPATCSRVNHGATRYDHTFRTHFVALEDDCLLDTPRVTTSGLLWPLELVAGHLDFTGDAVAAEDGREWRFTGGRILECVRGLGSATWLWLTDAPDGFNGEYGRLASDPLPRSFVSRCRRAAAAKGMVGDRKSYLSSVESCVTLTRWSPVLAKLWAGCPRLSGLPVRCPIVLPRARCTLGCCGPVHATVDRCAAVVAGRLRCLRARSDAPDRVSPPALTVRADSVRASRR